MPGKGWRGALYRTVRKALEAGELDRHGAKARLAAELGVSRQRITEVVQLVEHDVAQSQ